MNHLNMLIAHLGDALDNTAVRRLSRLVEAYLAMSGRITMLGLSRWSEKGASYRTIQRFFGSTLSWCRLNWRLVRVQCRDDEDVYLLVGDESTITKSGKKTYGLGRYFSSIYNRAVPGLSFLSVSLVSVKKRKAYPLLMEQVVPDEDKTTSEETTPTKPKKRVGRPKGSRNKNRSNPELSPHLLWVQALLRNLLRLMGQAIRPRYFVYDNALANNEAVAMLRPLKLSLISKLRRDAALWFPYEGEPRQGRGASRKYGDKLDYARIPERYLKESETTQAIQTNVYQMTVWHKRFAQKLNVVVIQKTNTKNQKTAQVVLFSTDLSLAWNHLIDYYPLRFQIEFTFRDAKQHWGLEDFMNIKQQQVYNAANLSMFMVNYASLLLREPAFTGMSVLDLKNWFRAGKYVRETLKTLPETAERDFIDRLIDDVARFGRIHPTVPA